MARGGFRGGAMVRLRSGRFEALIINYCKLSSTQNVSYQKRPSDQTIAPNARALICFQELSGISRVSRLGFIGTNRHRLV